MNLYIIAITGLSAGWASTLYYAWHYAGRADELSEKLKWSSAMIDVTTAERDAIAERSGNITNRLTALRRNCFLTNEKGHRVRYSKASEALRERAETN